MYSSEIVLRAGPDCVLLGSIPGIVSIISAWFSHIQTTFPRDTWVQVYTDGSSQNGTQNGGAGIYIQYPSEPEERISLPVGAHSTELKAETIALQKAFSAMMQRTNTPQKIVFFTDSLSLINTLISNNDKELNQLYSNLSDLNRTNTVVIQWVPSHCKLHGNEEADSLAKTGSRETQIDRSTSYKEEKSLIKKHQQNQWNANHPCHNKADPYHKLNRKEQVIIFRLRTGHNKLQYHLFNKFKVGETDLCSCTTDSQTVEHILQSYPLL